MFGKRLARERGVERRHVEEHGVGAGLLELVVDRARDDVTRCERAACVVALHERVAVTEAEHAAFAAQRFGDQEAAGVRVVEHRRVELRELEIAARGADAIGHRDAIAGRDIGVRRVDVDLAGSTAGEHRGSRADRLDVAALAIEHVRTEACRIAAVLRERQEVDRDVVFEDRDVRVVLDRGEQCTLDLATGDVFPMHDAVLGVRALAPEVEVALRVAIEPHAEIE